MPTLRELQLSFVDAMLSGKFDAIAAHVAIPESNAERRLSIYRNNMSSNLRAALREVYPIIEKLVGIPFFNHAATQFITSYPSISGDLNDYGEYFPDFLATYPAAAELPYLPDVARLEWALEKAYYAADYNKLELQRLAAISPSQYGSLYFKLHPAVKLIASSYPLFSIWEVHQPHYHGDGSVDGNAGEAMLLVNRRDHQVIIEPLEQNEFTFLSLLQNNHSFVDAVAAVTEMNPNFQLQACLVKRVTLGDIVDFSISSEDQS